MDKLKIAIISESYIVEDIAGFRKTIFDSVFL